MLAVPLEEWQPEWLIITRSNSRMTGIHVSHLSTEKHKVSGRAVESARLV
jgi:hypothetical protein